MLQGSNLTTLLVNLFKTNGFPTAIIPFAVAQVMHETGGKLDRPLEVQDFNISGINFINNKALQKDAVRGVMKPKREWKDQIKPEYYAKFANYDAWARDYKRLLSRNNGGKGKPIDSTTLKQFSERLAANNYFTDSPTNYANALMRWMQQIKNSLPADIIPLLLIIFAIILVA